MNPFFHLAKYLQWFIAIAMALILFLLFGLYTKILNISLFLGIFYLFLMIPFFQFLGTPIFTLTGIYHYLSPMLLVFGKSDKKYDLHNGTSFDYLLIMKKHKAGIEARTVILTYYLEGLLEIISRVENGKLPASVKIEGTSYFFSESTAKRLGFEVEEGKGFLKFNLYLNFIDLCWMYSYSQGKLSFPNLKEIKKASTSGKKLVENKKKIHALYQYLKKKQA